MQKILQNILARLSKAILKKYHPEVVGITGSVGKTSAKEAIAHVLAARNSVRKNYKNYNNEIGLPLTIIGIEKSPGSSVFGWLGVISKAVRLVVVKDAQYPKTLVLEMGADKPGDIRYLTTLAPCAVGVLTYISHAHTEFFGSLEKIAVEKRIIISHLNKNGIAIINADNQLALDQAKYTKTRIITYGTKSGAVIVASDIRLSCSEGVESMGISFKVLYEGTVVPIFVPHVISPTVVSAVLAAIAVGIAHGMNLVEIGGALRSLQPLAGHMRPLAGIKNTILLDDTYNSSPDAVKSALSTTAQIPLVPGAERYAVLGDMLELGTETQRAHREIGFKVAELGFDVLITVGEASKVTAAAAKEAGIPDHHIASFDDSVAAGKFLQGIMKEGDVILIKGSQGSRMEKIVKEVMAEPLLAGELLVRQEAKWLQS